MTSHPEIIDVSSLIIHRQSNELCTCTYMYCNHGDYQPETVFIIYSRPDPVR